jgi:integrase
MSLIKRGETWWIDITINGQRTRQSAGTSSRKEAQELHDKLKAQAWKEVKLGERPRKTFEQAALRWLEEKAHKKSLTDDADKIEYFKQHLAGKYLDEITRDMVGELLAKFKTPATKNRHVALIRAIMRRARDVWEWVDRVPAFQTYVEPQGRLDYLTREEFNELAKQLPEPWRSAAIVAVSTGLRRANVFGMRWDQVDLERGVTYVEARQAKGGRGIPVPLNDDALAAIRLQQGKHKTLVFAGYSRMSADLWKRCLKEAGLSEHFVWHHFRHTWASWHAMAGTPLHIIQTLGGWSTPLMVQRYAHLSQDHLIDEARRISLNVKPQLKVAA